MLKWDEIKKVSKHYGLETTVDGIDKVTIPNDWIAHNVVLWCSKDENHKQIKCCETRPRGTKTGFMLNSAEHEIKTAQKYRNSQSQWKFWV